MHKDTPSRASFACAGLSCPPFAPPQGRPFVTVGSSHIAEGVQLAIQHERHPCLCGRWRGITLMPVNEADLLLDVRAPLFAREALDEASPCILSAMVQQVLTR